MARFVLVLVSASLLAAGCHKTSADEHARNASAYFDAGRFQDAIIEYRRALQLDPRRGDLRLKLADTYLRVKDGSAAVREYVRAADLLPHDVDAQLKAGNMLLVARAFEDAKSRANRVLEIDPGNVRAQILRGNALAGLKDLDGAITDYENALSVDPSPYEAYVNLAVLRYSQGNIKEAEATFLKAVDSAPKSVDARLALANFYWATTPQKSEPVLKAAHDLEPNNITVNRALGVFYIATGRPADAEPYFKTIAATGNVPARLTLSQYYILTKQSDKARALLQELLQDHDAYATAMVRLAGLDASEGKRADAQVRVRELLAKYPKDYTGQLLNAVLLFGDHKRDEALAAVNGAIATDPQESRAYLLAGRILADADRNDEAIASFEQALKLDSRPLTADLELARLHFNAGATDKAITYVRQALAIAPQNPDAHAILTRIYLRRGEVDKATTEAVTLQKAFPTVPAALTLAALTQVAAKHPDAARLSFDRALERDPGDLVALEGLLSLDASAGRQNDTVARIDAALKRVTPTPDLLMLAARAHAAAKDVDGSEGLLRRAIELDPARIQAYAQLGALYVSQHRIPEARGQFENVLAKNPKSIAAVTMIGMLLEMEGNVPEAERRYDQALGIDSHAAVAANNLAYLYASTNRNLDQALQLAQTAQQQLPDEPHVGDTLGWIYVKKNMAALALPHLEASARKTPNDAVVHYHLGIAYLNSGDAEKAKSALTKALSLKPDFEGAADARKALSSIGS